jgi:hypothetical protein
MNERVLQNQITGEWYWFSAPAIERALPVPDGPADWDGWRYVSLQPEDWPRAAGAFAAPANRWGPPFPPSWMRDWGPRD